MLRSGGVLWADRGHRSDTMPAGILAATGLAVSVIFGLSSPEGILHFDDLTHFLYARNAWRWPAYLLDEWGRPGFTTLYSLPAALGWQACRVFSAILTAASAWIAFRVAQHIGLRHAWAVVPLCYAQPLFFQLSQTTLTETALAFYLISAIHCAQRGRWSWSAALISVGCVTRYEAIVFLPVWVFGAWRARVGLWRLWPLLWAPLAVTVPAAWAGMRPPLFKLFEPRPSTQYGQGGWLTFFSRSMEAWGPGVTVLAMVGIRRLWGTTRTGALAAACILAYFGAHVVIRALGLFDSGGYARFLVAISPPVAVAALLGLQALRAKETANRRSAVLVAAGSMFLLWFAMERQLVLHAARLDEAAELPELHQAKIAVRVAAAAIVALAAVSAVTAGRPRAARHTRALVPAGLLAMVLLGSYALCHPLRRPPEAVIIDDLVRWLDAHGLGDREIISANVWLDYATARELPPGRPAVRDQLRRAPPGTLFAWEKQFAASTDHGLPLETFLDGDGRYRLIHETRPAPLQRAPYLRIFEKTRALDPRRIAP